MITLLYNLYLFIIGSMIGSFLNVVIHRIPLGVSVVSPRSKCANCKKIIPWYENIPIISFLLLRGKCSSCLQRISIQYFLIEVMMGFLAIVFFMNYPLLDAIFFYNILSIFVVIFIIDFKHRIIPDKINLYLLSIIFLYSFFFKEPYFWLTGGLLGFGFPYLITWVFYKIKGVIGLGGGDIKLFGVLGLLLGPNIISTLFLSSFLGAIGGIIELKLIKKNSGLSHTIAFGPYIIIVAAIQIFFPKLFSLINIFSVS